MLTSNYRARERSVGRCSACYFDTCKWRACLGQTNYSKRSRHVRSFSFFFSFFFLRVQSERDTIDPPAASYSPLLYVYVLTRTRIPSPPRRRHVERVACVVRTFLLLPLLLFLFLRGIPRPPSRILIELSPLLMRLRSVSVEPRFRVTGFRVGVRPCVYRTRGCVRDAPYLFTHVVEYNCARYAAQREAPVATESAYVPLPRCDRAC